jgi:hypothetical protein
VYEFEITKGLSVSFQRYPYPELGSLSALPRSRGALPIHIEGPGQLTVPSPPAEAFWVALMSDSGSAPSDVAVLAYGRNGALVDVLTGLPVTKPPTAPSARLTLPPHQFIAGIRRSAGTWWPIAHYSSAHAPSSVALNFLVRTWPKTDEAVPRVAGLTRHHMSGEEAPRHRPPRISLTGVAEDATLHVVLLDELRFKEISGKQVAPLSPDPGAGDRRYP